MWCSDTIDEKNYNILCQIQEIVFYTVQYYTCQILVYRYTLFMKATNFDENRFVPNFVEDIIMINNYNALHHLTQRELFNSSTSSVGPELGHFLKSKALYIYIYIYLQK
jgi:hypothetical protein